MAEEIDIESLKNVVPIALGSRISFLRQKNGLSQIDLGRLIGNDRQYVSKIEKGQGNITIIKLATISHALNVTMQELVDFTY